MKKTAIAFVAAVAAGAAIAVFGTDTHDATTSAVHASVADAPATTPSSSSPRAAQPTQQSAQQTTSLPLITDLGPALNVAGWDIAYDKASVTVATDPSGAPALAMRFPAGYEGGSSPATVYYKKFSVSKIRWESTLSYPTNYVKHQSSVDKSVFVSVNDYNAMYTMMYDATRLIPAIGLQGIVNMGVSTNLTPNVAQVELQRGKRYVLACEATGNTAGQENGIVECWLDGTKFLRTTGIQFTRNDAKFTGIAWVPIWGGAGGTLPAPQSAYLGRLRVYGQ
ncbi:MAG TPA: hypothetical protein VJR92_07705 [Gemmatimonadaceae bacterium]|nr:hypothetical protein [Gemmatimonadaceae bacterium]